jgi:hypothetical protein
VGYLSTGGSSPKVATPALLELSSLGEGGRTVSLPCLIDPHREAAGVA